MANDGKGYPASDQPQGAAKATTEYLAASVDGIRDRLAALDEREARLISSASTATNWLRVALGFWSAILFGVFGLSAFSTYQLDEVIQQAKQEVRDIAGTSRPDAVNWGRLEPGDASRLLITLIVERVGDGRAALKAITYPKVDVIGNQAKMHGWRYTLHEQMLDWFSSSNLFKLDNPPAQFAMTESYRRAQLQYGEIIWLRNGDQNEALVLTPGASWAGLVSLSVDYSSCLEAIRAAEQLKNLSDEGRLGQIGLLPIIENFPTSEQFYDAEVLFFLDDDFECWQPENPKPSDPIPDVREL